MQYLPSSICSFLNTSDQDFREWRRCTSLGSISGILPIVRSEAKSWYNDDASNTHAPEKTYDGDYTTFYSRKDGDAEGNYLKLYLSQKYRIGTVKLTNRVKGCCEHRIVGTVVMLYTTQGAEEVKVINCGERITGVLNKPLYPGGGSPPHFAADKLAS